MKREGYRAHARCVAGVTCREHESAPQRSDATSRSPRVAPRSALIGGPCARPMLPTSTTARGRRQTRCTFLLV